MPTNRNLDNICIIFLVEKLSKCKKCEGQKKNDIFKTICTLLNSNGGKVESRGEEREGNLASTTLLDSLGWSHLRMIGKSNKFSCNVSQTTGMVTFTMVLMMMALFSENE